MENPPTEMKTKEAALYNQYLLMVELDEWEIWQSNERKLSFQALWNEIAHLMNISSRVK